MSNMKFFAVIYCCSDLLVLFTLANLNYQISRGSFWYSWPNFFNTKHVSNSIGTVTFGEETKCWEKKADSMGDSSLAFKSCIGRVCPVGNRCWNGKQRVYMWLQGYVFQVEADGLLLCCHSMVISDFRRKAVWSISSAFQRSQVCNLW